MKQFDLFLKLLTLLRQAHPHVTANQVQMFLVIANNPGITSTGIAKALSLPGERFVTVASVARGLDVLGGGRQQKAEKIEVDPETGRKIKTGQYMDANFVSMGLLKWTTDARGRRNGFWLSQSGEDLLARVFGPEKMERSSSRFEMPAPLAA